MQTEPCAESAQTQPSTAPHARTTLDARWLASLAPATARPVEASVERSNMQYRALAAKYDTVTPRIEALRDEAHRLLRLSVGDTVIDAGCGTGKSLQFLSATVGASGRVVAIEPCREMIEIARERVRLAKLDNVTLIEGDVCALREQFALATVNAVLLMFTHDLLQSRASIATLLALAKPGARFALAGGKLFSGPLSLLNPWVEWRQKPYCTTFENYDAPWRKLFATDALAHTQVHPRYMGIAYIAHGERAP